MKAILILSIVLLSSCSVTYVNDGGKTMISASLITSQDKTITPTRVTEKAAKAQAGILKSIFNFSFWKTLITSL